MRWFEGGIPSAIQAAKANKSVFIVFIAGEDKKTEEMESYLHSEEVTRLCEESNCVAVKLSGSGDDCKFFSQIYPVVVIPSTFFIGDNGVPLEVIGDCKSKQDFYEKIKKTIEMQRSMSAEAARTNTSGAEGGGATGNGGGNVSTSAQSEQKSATSSSPTLASAGIEDDKEIGGATAQTPAAPESGSGDENTPIQRDDGQDQSLTDKVERAKELLEQKRQEKMRKEAEEARRKEIERRNLGQGVQKLREQQKEMEMKEAKREFQKDKEDDRLARQRVKEEIERDRAEKAMRFNKEKNERAQAAEEARKKKLVEQQAALAAEQARKSNIARIQFRMADGSSLTQQFPATDTFSSVHQFITQHVGSEVRLSTTFPRRTFTAEDEGSSLQDLQLAPSAAVLVLPGGHSTAGVRSSSDSMTLSSLTSLVLSPFLFIWNLLSSLLGLSGSPAATTTSRDRQAAAAEARGRATATGGDRDRGSALKRPASASSRQEGGIRRFRNAEDDDDDEERNTWNGNSTQQM